MKTLDKDLFGRLQAFIETGRKLAEELTEVFDEAEDSFSEKSENWQDSDKGQAYTEWMQKISDAATVIEEAIPQLEEVEINTNE